MMEELPCIDMIYFSIEGHPAEAGVPLCEVADGNIIAITESSVSIRLLGQEEQETLPFHVFKQTLAESFPTLGKISDVKIRRKGDYARW